MDINAAEATIDQLFKGGLVKNVADLYNLDYDAILGLERFGDKSAQNLIDSIEASKQVPFPRVLFALGIRYVGETVAKKLAEAFLSLEKLMAADIQTLEEVDEIGERIAESVINYFQDTRNQIMVHQLRDHGLQFEMETGPLKLSENLSGKSFVISGVFEKHSRDELKAFIDQHGGKNSGSISKKTDYIVAGANMGPSKYQKAQKLNIPILSEEEFLSMLS